jgi:hypothetical protein
MVQTPFGYGLIETLGGLDFNCTGGIGSNITCDGQGGGSPPHTMAGG